MNLIVDGMNMGKIKEYHQDRESKAWIFTLENEVEIKIHFASMRNFTSPDGTSKEILTKHW